MSGQLAAGTQHFHLPDAFALESGEVLRGARLAYRTWGTPASVGRSVLVCHPLTGSADVDDWWPGLIGNGLALDPRYDYVVCSNVLGGCSGSTGPADVDPAGGRRYGARFPALTLRDLVRAQALLLDALGIGRLDLVLGGSLGGMQALEWAASFPGRVASLAVLAAAATQPAWALAQSHVQRLAITGDPDWCGGDYAAARPPRQGLALARMIAMNSYRHWSEFEVRFGRRCQDGDFAVQAYLDHHGRRIVQRFDAASYVTLTRIMDTHDIARGRGDLDSVLAAMPMPALVLGVDSDLLYPAEQQRALAAALPQGRYVQIASCRGHDGFLLEAATVGQALLRFRQGRG